MKSGREIQFDLLRKDGAMARVQGRFRPRNEGNKKAQERKNACRGRGKSIDY